MEQQVPPTPSQIVSKKNVKTWHAWLTLGLVVGISAGVILVANRSGEFEARKAAQELPPAQDGLVSITVDTQKVVGKIPPKFYGAGHEDNTDFIVPDNLRLETIRFRAGCDVEEFYHWRDYVGPVMNKYNYSCHDNNPQGGGWGPLSYPRPAREAPYHRISLDDALTYMRNKGIEIILAANFGTGTGQERQTMWST